MTIRAYPLADRPIVRSHKMPTGYQLQDSAAYTSGMLSGTALVVGDKVITYGRSAATGSVEDAMYVFAHWQYVADFPNPDPSMWTPVSDGQPLLTPDSFSAEYEDEYPGSTYWQAVADAFNQRDGTQWQWANTALRSTSAQYAPYDTENPYRLYHRGVLYGYDRANNSDYGQFGMHGYIWKSSDGINWHSPDALYDSGDTVGDLTDGWAQSSLGYAYLTVNGVSGWWRGRGTGTEREPDHERNPVGYWDKTGILSVIEDNEDFTNPQDAVTVARLDAVGGPNDIPPISAGHMGRRSTITQQWIEEGDYVYVFICANGMSLINSKQYFEEKMTTNTPGSTEEDWRYDKGEDDWFLNDTEHHDNPEGVILYRFHRDAPTLWEYYPDNPVFCRTSRQNAMWGFHVLLVDGQYYVLYEGTALYDTDVERGSYQWVRSHDYHYGGYSSVAHSSTFLAQMNCSSLEDAWDAPNFLPDGSYEIRSINTNSYLRSNLGLGVSTGGVVVDRKDEFYRFSFGADEFLGSTGYADNTPVVMADPPYDYMGPQPGQFFNNPDADGGISSQRSRQNQWLVMPVGDTGFCYIMNRWSGVFLTATSSVALDDFTGGTAQLWQFEKAT